MTSVRMLTTLAGPDGVVQAGQRIALDDALAAALVEGGYAVLVITLDAPPAIAEAAQPDETEGAGEVETTDLPIGKAETATARPQRKRRA